MQHGVYDTFTKRLAETAGAMMVVDEFGPGACMKAVEKVEVHIADALKKGAKVVTGGKRAAQGGSFFEPTVLTDVTTDMVITKEETFGPVAPLYRFKSEADAVKMANEAPTLTLPRARGREGRGLASYFLEPRHRPHLAGRRGARIRHRRHQRKHHLDRDRALRRHEGSPHTPCCLIFKHCAGFNASEKTAAVIWA